MAAAAAAAAGTAASALLLAVPVVVEADDAVSLGKFTNQWVDLCETNIVPLMTDEEVGQVLSAG